MKKHKRVINLEAKPEIKNSLFGRVLNFEVDALRKEFVRPIDWVVDEKSLETNELIDYAHYADEMPRLEARAKVLKDFNYRIVKLFSKDGNGLVNNDRGNN